jgi:fatty-acyl-CoA synthase
MEEIRITDLASIERVEKTPFAERFDIRNTYEMIKQGAMINPQAPAITFLLSGDLYEAPTQVTYREFLKRVNQTANLLHDLGIGPRDVVSYLLPNLPHTHYVLWGAEAEGVANPINPMLEPSTIADICRAADTRVLVALGEFPGSDIWKKALEVRRQLPNLKAIIRVLGPSDEADGIYGFDEVIERYRGDGLDSNRDIGPDEMASIYHTGGTTGLPKLAPHTHRNEVAVTLTADMPAELTPRDTLLVGLPLFHINGTLLTGSFPFSKGAHVVLLSPQGYRDASIIRNFYRIVERYKATTFSAVPTVLSMLLDTPKGDADISTLRYVICGAAPLSVDLFKKFEAYTGLRILEIYGLTEGNASCNPYHGERKIGSIGLRLPYHEMRIFIVDGDGSFVREAKTNEIGSVCVKGPCVFPGYLEEVHNTGIWAKEGWFNTGDLGRQDADGYFWLTGRKKELIIRGGHNIDPQIIEDALYRLPQVRIAAAVGRPDPHAGEVPVAYVQFQAGSILTEEEVLQHLRHEIGERAAVPKSVYVLNEMPLTPVGKIFKPALCFDAARRAYSIALEPLGAMVESVEVQVKADKTHGSLATIVVKPAAGIEPEWVSERIRDLLARYTIRYDLEFM